MMPVSGKPSIWCTSAHTFSTKHLGFMSKSRGVSSSLSHNIAYGTDRDPIAFSGVCFWIDGPEQTYPNQCTKVVLLAGGPCDGALELRICAAEGGRHRSLPRLRQRLGADPACCRGRNLALLRRPPRTRICAQGGT